MAYCDEYTQLISAAIDGALSPAQQEKLNAHLTQCPDCRALLEDLTALHTQLGQLPQVEPPDGLTESIMAAVRDSNVTLLPAQKPFYWKKWLSSAAVLALIIAAGWSWSAGRFGGASSAVPVAAMGASNTTGQVTADALISESDPADSEAMIASDAPEVSVRAAAGAIPEPASAPLETAAPVEYNGYGDISDALHNDFTQHSRLAADPDEEAIETVKESDLLAPRMFSVQTTGSDGSSDMTIGEESSPEEPIPAESVPAPFALTSIPPEGAAADTATPIAGIVSLTREQAVTALANYIYEFVEQVEPAALEETELPTWYLSSPTGVSGTATLIWEDETVFFFDYRDSESETGLSYTVDKADATVTWLGEAPVN